MRKKFLIALAVTALLAAVWLTLQGTNSLAVASPIKSEDHTWTGNAPAQETTCNSCADCTTKLASGTYATVTLAVDLTNQPGTCIGLIFGESDVAFDCDGHTIDGDDQAIDPDAGIAMIHGSNNKILHCTISDFSKGIQLADSSNFTIHNNHITSNGTGLDIGTGDANDVRYNTVDENVTGIYLHNTTNNTIHNNIVCDNVNYDFSLSGSSGNTGDDNTCDKPDGWNDQGTTGCTNMCTGSITCNSCLDCSNKLNGTFNRVLLANDITDYDSGTCISFGTDNVEFNCDGHTIDGSGTDNGIYMNGNSGNTVTRCTITDFYRAIALNGSSNNTITWNTIENSTVDGMYLWNSSNNNTISFNDIGTSGQYGAVLESSSDNTFSLNDLLCNHGGIRLNNATYNDVNMNTACSNPGPDFDLIGSTTGTSGSGNQCDAPNGWNDTGQTGCTYLCNSLRCSTCSDGVQSGDEEGVDCGGTYCPPCSQCSGEASTKWAPPDTPCNNKWPTSDGPNIGMNTTSDSCNLVEVCDPGLDYILEDALTCCEYEDYATRLTGSRLNGKIAACNYAHRIAYHGSFASLNPNRLKTCLAHYTISGFGGAAVYMQGYMHGEFCCAGSENTGLCPSACDFWTVDPAAWQMGTANSCAGSGGETPDFQMGGHRCEYTDAWIFGNYGRDGYWSSDTDWRSNSDSVVDTPTHASINRLSTGTCVDYSFAVTTILRKAGYTAEDVLSVQGVGHGYNLVRFPGEAMWHYVDTVGNRGGEVFGGADWPHPWFAWYDYCDNMTGGCSNDVHTQSRSHCPPDESIFGCADALHHADDSVSPPEPTVKPDPRPSCVPPNDPEQADPTCTELNPCTKESTSQPSTPGPEYLLDVVKEVSAEEITLGDSLEIRIRVQNAENKPIDVIVEETFAPGVAYDLDGRERSYDGFTFQYYQWSLDLPASGEVAVTFTAVPSDVGYFVFNPTGVYTGSRSYRSNSIIVKVACNPNDTCDPGESWFLCPQDCPTGGQDGYCDMIWDGITDPDCADGADPDTNPADDTDADGVLDGDDKCPLTPAGAFVDADGCTCEQKICADEDPFTTDGCNETTAECEFTPDADQDEVPDSADNCPNAYNPEQYDTDSDNTGDQCEIPPITADTTLDGGTYYVRDLDLEGAVTITASNVTLDCNGATLIGIDGGVGYGIYVPDHVDNVTIQNCTVQGYRYGIYVDSASDNQLLGNTVQTNAFGIILDATSGNTIANNTASGNTQAGIYLEGCSDNQAGNNTVNANGNVGLFIHTSSNNDFSDNTVCGNTGSDFSVYDSTNTGDDNTCDNPAEWNDEGTSGCTNTCGHYYIYLPIILRSYP